MTSDQRRTPRTVDLPVNTAFSSLFRDACVWACMCKTMNLRITIVLLCAMSAGPASAQLVVQYPLDLASRVDELSDGGVIVEVVVDGTLVHSDTLALVDAPPAAVFAVVSDFAGQLQWAPNLTEARVISGNGQHLVGEGTTDLAWPFSDRSWQIAIFNRPETFDGESCYASSWDYIPGSGDMIENDGYFLICPWEPDPSRSLVRYVFLADAGVSVPDFIERSVTAQMSPQFIRSLRRRVRSVHP